MIEEIRTKIAQNQFEFSKHAVDQTIISIFSISRGRWGCEGGIAALTPPLPQIIEMIPLFATSAYKNYARQLQAERSSRITLMINMVRVVWYWVSPRGADLCTFNAAIHLVH
jgi:hypothetical protein